METQGRTVKGWVVKSHRTDEPNVRETIVSYGLTFNQARSDVKCLVDHLAASWPTTTTVKVSRPDVKWYSQYAKAVTVTFVDQVTGRETDKFTTVYWCEKQDVAFSM